jgi:FdhE protein
MSREAWLEAHAYLRPLATFCAEVESAAKGATGAGAPLEALPSWDEYASDFREGVPLLQSGDAAIDLEPAGRAIVALVEKLAARSLPEKSAEMRALHDELRRNLDAPQRVVAWLLGEESLEPSTPGLLRYVGWTATARWLRPIVSAFATWRDDERWLRGYCPTCGSPPAMAQLVGVDPGRIRYLACGRCTTRWRYVRTACPFCSNDSQRLAVVAIEGEARLRIDSCESCRGYLKTYIGQGEEEFFLSDWTSLHLDVIATDRGLIRMAGSLFDLESAQ